MCVIIDLQPNVKLPYDKLERACDINKHGYGIAFLEKGRIKIARSLAQPNDPKEVADQLERYKKKRLWLHLRHATVGNVSEVNSHPLVVMTKDQDGRDLYFMHNGTLWDFDPKTFDKDLSDSAWFAKSFLRPLCLRFAAWMPNKSFLADEMFQRLVCKYITGDSKLVFFDNMGGVMYINRPKGTEFPGFWASNEYSFDKNHARSSDRSVYQTPGQRMGGHDYSSYGTPTGPKITSMNSAFRQQMERTRTAVELPWEKETTLIIPSKPSPGLFVIDNSAREANPAEDTKSRARTRFEFREARSIIETSNYKGTSIMSAPGVISQALEVKRSTFVELSGIQKLEDVGRLSRTQLVELSENFPNAAAELIIDLLAAYVKTQKAQSAQAVANG